MKEKVKNIFSFFLRFGLSAGLLFYLFKNIDLNKSAVLLKTADVIYLFYAGLVFLVINGILLLRWFLYVRALGLQVPLVSVIRYFFIGLFGNLFLPSAIGGDVIKIFGLCVHTSQKAKVVASVILDRLSGFAGMAVVAIVSFAFGSRLIDDMSLVFSISGMFVASAGFAVILFNRRIYSFCCQIFSRLPKLQKSLMNLHDDIALLKNRQDALWIAVGLSCVAQILAAISFFFIAKALHQDIRLVYFIIFMPLICVAASMPSIGGLGVREAGAAYLFAKVGVESGISVSISLINFLFMVLAGLIGGIIYLATRPSLRGDKSANL